MAWNSKVDAGWVTLEFDPPLSRLQEVLDEIPRDLSNMRTPLTESVKKVVIPSIDTNFEVGGRPESWTPLSPETVNRRERQGTGTQILVETGGLRTSATQFSRWTVDRQSAAITNWPARDIMKATVHTAGGSRVGKNAVTVPPRPFLMIQDEDNDKIEAIFLAWMELRARGRWMRR